MVRQALTLCVILLIIPARVHAEEGPCLPQDYDSDTQPRFDCLGPGEAELRVDLSPPETVPVHEGEEIVVPWVGALVHRHRLLEVGLNLQAVRRLRWLDRLRLSEECAIELEHAQEVAQARLGFMEAQRDGYQERWRAAEERTSAAQAWYRSPILWFAVGVVATGALVALTAYALHVVGGT